MTLKAQTVNTVVSKNPITSQKGKSQVLARLLLSALYFLYLAL